MFLLGHSYGAHCALASGGIAAGSGPELVLYEPARPELFRPVSWRARSAGAERAWDDFAMTFFRDATCRFEELEALRATEHWPPIIADAPASLGDLRALTRYAFDAARYRTLDVPVLLQIGSESPRDLYVTDALAAVLPDARIEALPGQAHEGMTTAPEMYVEAVRRFLLESAASTPVERIRAASSR